MKRISLAGVVLMVAGPLLFGKSEAGRQLFSAGVLWLYFGVAGWKIPASAIPWRKPGVKLGVACLLLAAFPAGSAWLSFSRQLRAQWGRSGAEKRAAHFRYQTGVEFSQVDALKALIPEGAHVLVLRNRQASSYLVLLLHYYLAPRKLYNWTNGPAYHLLDGRRLAFPDRSWMERHDIQWVLEIYGARGNKIRVLQLDKEARVVEVRD